MLSPTDDETGSMSADAAVAPVDDRPIRWHLLTRVAFRFCVVYFGLFCLLLPQVMFVFTGIFGWWLPPGAICGR